MAAMNLFTLILEAFFSGFDFFFHLVFSLFGASSHAVVSSPLDFPFDLGILYDLSW